MSSRLILIFTILTGLSLPVFTQTVLGTLTGRVLDATGAAVINAAVTATNTGTNLTYRTKTNETGNYVLQQLPVGDYEVTIEDSKVFSRPWKMRMPLYRRLEQNAQLQEYIRQPVALLRDIHVVRGH